jgi:hypothetical protein
MNKYVITIALLIVGLLTYILVRKEKYYNIIETKYNTGNDFYNSSGYHGAFAPIPPRIYIDIVRRGNDDPYGKNSGYELDINPRTLFKDKADIYINGKPRIVTTITKNKKGLISMQDLDYDENHLVSLQVRFDDSDDLYGTNFIQNQITPRPYNEMVASILLKKITLKHTC